MDKTRELLERVRSGELGVEDALAALKTAPVADLGYARVDLHRRVRQGAAEVIYGAGKTPEQIAGVARALRDAGEDCVLITRLDPEKAEAVDAILRGEENCRGQAPGPQAAPGHKAVLDYRAEARIGIVGAIPAPDGRGSVVIATGGTSDIPVAEEAAVTAEALGNRVVRLYDVGVAGLHRLLAHTDELTRASVVVAIAGMEGALASVVGGLVDCPVIAVPTSVGYGAAFGGVSALLGMLNSCAAGVSVVNIDNGFGAGFLASRINHIGI